MTINSVVCVLLIRNNRLVSAANAYEDQRTIQNVKEARVLKTLVRFILTKATDYVARN
jgi:hypothetical protein